MIDTILLNISGGYKITEPYLFKHTIIKGCERWIQNPNNKAPFAIYKPNLTKYARGFGGQITEPLLIQFSVPKLIYGNNIDEVSEADFDKIIITLIERLKEMGVIIWKDSTIRNASVSKIDFSKNIILDDFMTSSMIIRDLNKIDVGKRPDFDKKDFKNNGQELQIYYNSYSIAIYDKMNDINKPVGRAMDKDKTHLQQTLFREYRDLKRPKEMLRYEARFTRAKLKSLLKEIKFYEQPTFKNLFNRDLSRQILQYYWKKFIEDKSYILILLDDNPERLFQTINDNAQCRISLEKNLALGFISVLIDKFGTQGARKIIETKFHTRTWTRFDKKTIKGSLPDSIKSVNYIKYIAEALDKFEPVSISDIGLNEFDNVKESKV